MTGAIYEPAVDFLVMGGVSFEFSGVELALDRSITAFTTRSSTPNAVHVRCRVQEAQRLESGVQGRQVDVSWEGDVCRTQTAATRSALRRTGTGFEADAVVRAEAPAARELLPSLLAAALADSGGLLLHASGIEIDGRAVLFIGPSGAGKSTAARLTEGGDVFTWDRAAISWDGATPVAWALPGGSARSQSAGARSSMRLPLAAVFRIRQGVGRPRGLLQPSALSPADALALVRESVFNPRRDREGEGEALAAALHLCGTGRVGVIETVLGVDLTPLVRELVREIEELGA